VAAAAGEDKEGCTAGRRLRARLRGWAKAGEAEPHSEQGWAAEAAELPQQRPQLLRLPLLRLPLLRLRGG
jgi:hypothetical protein